MKKQTMLNSCLKVLAVSVLAFSAPAGAVNLVQNGNFTATTNGNGQLGYNTNATSWTTSGYNFLFAPGTADTTGATGVYGSLTLWGPGNGSNNGLGASVPGGGNFVAADGAFNVGAITQTISGLTVGKTYDLTFNWAAAQQYGFYGATTEQWQVSLGGNTQSTAVYSLPSQGFSGWMSASLAYTATAATETLSFLAVGAPNGVPPFSLLTNVSMVAIPEPGVIALLGIGLLTFLVGKKGQYSA